MADTDSPSILLVDHTAPVRRTSDYEGVSRTNTQLSRISSKRWNKPSVRSSLKARKYAKWQPQRLGIAGDSSDIDRKPSDAGLTATDTNQTNPLDEYSSSTPPVSEHHAIDTADFALDAPTLETEAGAGSGSGTGSRSDSRTRTATRTETEGTRKPSKERKKPAPTRPGAFVLHPGSELDILYENQRGWFFFGVPLYSHSSLLNFDPSAWVTHDNHHSPVNITNAQLPDPSWEWAWTKWYVDMSGDVDEQGWQYAFSFGSSAWHGSHPWFHSFVRRRRWVRLRNKRGMEKNNVNGKTGFEAAHMLTADYFTIHSSSHKKKRGSMAGASSSYWSRAAPKVEEEEESPQEVSNIPSLFCALKRAVVDRQKIEALKRFVEEGGEELFYLDGKIPDIMDLFVFQAARWEFLTYLTSVLDDLSRQASQSSGMEAEEIRRKHGHLSKAAETALHHLTGPEVFHPHGGEAAAELLDLTPQSKRRSLLQEHAGDLSKFKPMDNGGEIRGIPKEAEVGREGHIYRYTK